MNIARFSLDRRVFTLSLAVMFLLAGLYVYPKLGRLEDPNFTIKTAVVVTSYPGASAVEVEQEVTEPVESGIQKLGEVDEIRSISVPGRSIIYVDIMPKYRAEELDQIWDELRKKVNLAAMRLPPGAETPIVEDDFGDVFGVYYAMTGPRYTMADLTEAAEELRKELLLVKDVASVELYGDPMEVVYIEVSRDKLANLGISPQVVIGSLQNQNLVVSAGDVETADRSFRISTSGMFSSVDEIGRILIPGGQPNKFVTINDLATVRRGYREPPSAILHYNGQPAVGIGISTVADGNVVDMGEALEARLGELRQTVPNGMEIHKISYQPETVKKAVNNFVINLLEAVAIVIVVLLGFMGLRVGLLIGATLVMTIAATFVVMYGMGINLQNISLGALIIALGMLVDNAIVVAEGVLIKIQQGKDRYEAAIDTVGETLWPLFGATIIAILAFAAIAVSDDVTGEYLQSLFQVIAISLLFSWMFAITLTPLLCSMVIRPSAPDGVDDPYAGRVYRGYAKTLDFVMRHRAGTMIGFTALLLLAFVGFANMKQAFFPNSPRPQFKVDVLLPEGTRIEETMAVLDDMSDHLLEQDGVTNIAETAGDGGLRFMLTYSPEPANSAYGMLLVSVEDESYIDGLIDVAENYIAEHVPQANGVATRFAYGPSSGAVAVRFKGRDSAVLRSLAEQAKSILRKDDAATFVRDDWREKILTHSITLKEAQLRNLGISRADVNKTLAMNFDGLTVGMYREADELLPIITRSPEEYRDGIEDIESMQIFSPVSGQYVPMLQVVEDYGVAFEDGRIHRTNRTRTLTVKAENSYGTADEMFRRVKPAIDAMQLPAGYDMEWGGEYESSSEAQGKLLANVPIAFIGMVLTLILMFNSVRHALIIFLCLPFAVIGVAFGLLGTGIPFTFLALLGFLSLSGMLIKNAIVLLDEIDRKQAMSDDHYEAIVEASVSRVRPVAMAAATTVLGMVPLLFDVFFRAMAVAVIGGLSFATILTLFLVPLLYAMLFRVSPDEAH